LFFSSLFSSQVIAASRVVRKAAIQHLTAAAEKMAQKKGNCRAEGEIPADRRANLSL
jgi:hypothetical protein